MMVDDGASSASALVAHSLRHPQNSGRGAKSTLPGSSPPAEQAARHPAMSPPPSFGIDPPRPPREGLEGVLGRAPARRGWRATQQEQRQFALLEVALALNKVGERDGPRFDPAAILAGGEPFWPATAGADEPVPVRNPGMVLPSESSESLVMSPCSSKAKDEDVAEVRFHEAVVQASSLKAVSTTASHTTASHTTAKRWYIKVKKDLESRLKPKSRKEVAALPSTASAGCI
ncbi:hypothetical protein TCAP_01434 [Tolypocladium capitatum]|uniref:Uncharacterized protein n=1 Tax=Tolypocladium capitatum TaxID=45235 RepID=A0A2K3QM88_9HYPO|nr:hypothetical protein TCAP_01434 [Tolypocladium capitatum]